MEQLRAALTAWLDPEIVGAFLLHWGGRLLAALAIFVIGRIVAIVLSRWGSRAMHRVGMDQTLSRFFGSLIYIVLIIMVVLTAVNSLGVPTTNFLAIVGAAGLAVGLALKDSLANFSSGVMLVFFRPFRVGDAIQAAGVSGIVETIGIFSTVVKTPDNVVITVPNSLIYAGPITNFTAEPTRRIDIVVAIGYEASIAEAKSLIREVLHGDRRVLVSPAPEIVVNDLGQNSVNLIVRAWTATADLPGTRADLLERVKETFERNGLGNPYPRMRLERHAPKPAAVE